MSATLFRLFLACAVFFAGADTSFSADLPLLKTSEIVYQGAFRLPASTYGGSSLNYSEGPLEYNASRHSLYIVGHAHDQQIAEFAVPPLVKSENIADLAMAGPPLQNFSEVLARTTGGNPQSLDRIGGMEYIDQGGSSLLLINAYEYYDAPGDNTQTTLVAGNSDSLGTCTMDGFHSFAGGAGHTSGWLSPIPRRWQSFLGGTHITGQSSGIPIISRTSVGPSAFSFDHLDLSSGEVNNPVATVKLLDFSLTRPLHADLSNTSGSNDLWTHLSRVAYGLVVPATRTYLTVGHSGGHMSGVCYKCVQNNGRLCGGYCARDAEDYYHYYWLWDLDDLVDVKEGRRSASSVRPYDYGEFETPFATGEFGGGTFDPGKGLLYLTVQKADRAQGTYSNPPIVVAFSFAVTAAAVVAPPSFLLLND